VSDLRTRAEVAAQFGVSEKTLRRLLPTIPGLAPIHIGRRVLFTLGDIAMIAEARRCPCTSHAAAAGSGMLAALSGSARRGSPSKNTAQDVLRELMRTEKRQRETRRSVKKSLKVHTGGRGASL
jgi:hypothetical protein